MHQYLTLLASISHWFRLFAVDVSSFSQISETSTCFPSGTTTLPLHQSSRLSGKHHSNCCDGRYWTTTLLWTYLHNLLCYCHYLHLQYWSMRCWNGQNYLLNGKRNSVHHLNLIKVVLDLSVPLSLFFSLLPNDPYFQNHWFLYTLVWKR